jgi:3-phosphoshikimate 1-carboxyvinyltransferase
MKFEALGPLRGELRFPGDKSICHRALMLGALAAGDTRIANFSGGGDNRSTLTCLRRLGVVVDELTEEPVGKTLIVHGVGLHGLREADDVLDAGNSGTTMRILSGLLAGQPFFSVLTGDEFLRKRPMRRVITPLRKLGAEILGREGDTKAPLAIKGRRLTGAAIALEVASAQVKSALILAGLYAEGETTVVEPGPSRDHTERMLTYMGAKLAVAGRTITVTPGATLHAGDVHVPGDISSAAFFMVAGLIVPGSEIVLRDVGVNPTRTGIIDILRQMGGRIELTNEREVAGEPVADIVIKSSTLKGVSVGGDVVVRAIDEFPILAVAATQAEGDTRIEGAEELRVKETDRIRAMTSELTKLGAHVEELKDGMVIRGGRRLHGAACDSYHDHRIAMSLAVAAQVAASPVEIGHFDMVAISYPGFVADLTGLARG